MKKIKDQEELTPQEYECFTMAYGVLFCAGDPLKVKQ